MSDVVVDRNAPSVRTLWRGTGTAAAVTQAMVVFAALMVTLGTAYLALSEKIAEADLAWLLRALGIGVAALATAYLWRNPRRPRWVQRNEFIYPALMGVLNLWPVLLAAVWARSGASQLAHTLVADRVTSLMAVAVMSLAISAGVLVFRMVSELINPLAGNAIELVTEKWRIEFEKWKIARDGARIDPELAARYDAALAEIQRLRKVIDDLKSNPQVRFVASNHGSARGSGSDVFEQGMLRKFLIGAWGDRGWQRRRWVGASAQQDYGDSMPQSEWQRMVSWLERLGVFVHERPRAGLDLAEVLADLGLDPVEAAEGGDIDGDEVD